MAELAEQSVMEEPPTPEPGVATPEQLSSTLTASPGIWGSIKRTMFGLGSHPLSLSDSEGSDEDAGNSGRTRGSRSFQGRSCEGHHTGVELTMLVRSANQTCA